MTVQVKSNLVDRQARSVLWHLIWNKRELLKPVYSLSIAFNAATGQILEEPKL